jgi:uncharacterized membrane protein YhaH (DUF805 family)
MNKRSMKKNSCSTNCLWFKAKNYGWGWYPCSWQGWLVLLAWAAIFILLIDRAEDSNNILANSIIPVLVLTAILISICYVKGEKPVWRWGKK